MKVWSALYVRIRVTCAEPAYILSKLSSHGIALADVLKENDISVIIGVKPSDYKETISLLNRWQVGYTISDDSIHRHTEKRFFSRVMLKLAIIILLAISMYLPGKILFVFVSGNSSVPTREIIEAAGTKGICFGAKAADVRSEKVKNGLLEMIPDLQWVGVNTNGCIATIQVEEKTATNNIAETDERIVSIVASTSGIVESCTATQGTLLCKVGQAVAEGETLISGYTDCGLIIKAAKAQGEVYALTTHVVNAVTPISGAGRDAIESEKVNFSIKIGKKLINFNNSSGIYHGTCAKIYEEQYMVLPGGFVLPVSVIKETVISYQFETTEVQLWPDEACLIDHIDQLLKSQMVAGNINKRFVQLEKSDRLIILNTRYICTEMIGRQKTEQFLQGEFSSD